MRLRRTIALFLAFSTAVSCRAGRLDLLQDSDLDVPRRGSAMAFFRTASLVAAGAMLFDGGVREDLFNFRNSEKARHLRTLGDRAQLAGPALGAMFLVHGLAFDDPRSRQTALLAYQSFVVSGLLATGLKSVVGRERPSSTDSPGKFFSGGGDSSFPSGHTTTAFAAATVFAKQYPHWYVAIPAYGAATAVGYSRLSSNKHWVSDVVAGAAIGYGVSHLLWRRANPRKERTVELSVAPDGVTVSKKF